MIPLAEALAMPAKLPWYRRWMLWTQLVWLGLLVTSLVFLLRQPQPAPAPPVARPRVDAQDPPAPQAKALRLAHLESIFDESLPAGAVARFGTLRFRAGGLPALAFTSDGKSLWTSSYDRGVAKCDVATGQRTTGIGPWVFEEGGYKSATGIGLLCQHRPLLACLDNANRIIVWHLHNQEEVARCSPGIEPVQTVAIAPYGDLLAASAKDGAVRLWELPSGRLRHCWHLPHKDIHPVLAIASDGKTVAAVFDLWGQAAEQKHTLYCWDAITGQFLFSCANDPNHGGWDSITFATSKLLVTASMGKQLCWWDVPSGNLLQTDDLAPGYQGNSFYRVDLVANRVGDVLTTGGLDGFVRLWDTKERKFIRKFGGRGDNTNLAYSPDEQVLATANMEGAIRLWDVKSGRELEPREGHLGTIKQLSFTSDGKKLISAATDNTIRIWDVAAVKELHVLEGHQTAVQSLAAHGTTLLSCSHDSWCTWDSASGRLVDRHPHEEGWVRFALFPDHRTLAKFRYGTGELSIQQRTKGDVLRTLPALAEEDSVPVVSPDGRFLAWSQTLWRTRTGQQLHAFHFKPLPVQQGWNDDKPHILHAVAFAPNSRIVATGGADGALRFWEVVTGKELACWSGDVWPVYAVAFSPDGRWLACTAAGATVQLRDALTGNVVQSFQMRHGGGESHLVFSPDNKYLATACYDSSILLWDVEKATRQYRRPHIDLAPDELTRLWQNLADPDGKVAYSAMMKLARAAPAAAPFLEERLRELHQQAATAAAATTLSIRALSAETFADRQKAMRDLSALGLTAEPFLRAARRTGSDLETVRRLDVLINALDSCKYPVEHIRAMRALTVLELVATAEATAALANLSRQEPHTWVSQEAGATQGRDVEASR